MDPPPAAGQAVTEEEATGGAREYRQQYLRRQRQPAMPTHVPHCRPYAAIVDKRVVFISRGSNWQQHHFRDAAAAASGRRGSGGYVRS